MNSLTMNALRRNLSLRLVLISLFFPNLLFAATLTSTVNRNEISTNETLNLTVSIDQQVNSSALDLSALQNDFEILASTPQSRSSINIVNGKSEKKESTTWSIVLVAKRQGRLRIPAFTIGSASSQAINIKVNNSVSNTSQSDSALHVDVKSNAKTVYPNQQFIVEIELSARSNVGDLNGSQLEIANANVEVIDQQSFRRVDNGIARQIVVLKYAVFAERAGELTIPAMTYTGLENARRSFFGANGTQVIARSKAIKIKVLEAVKNQDHPWFTAQDVSISSSLSEGSAVLKVGEPITRSITITAKGQQANAIPPLVYGTLAPQLKSYRDQAQQETSKSNQGLVGTRVESEAIVANEPGTYVLPEINIHWWNAQKKAWQTSTLEEQTLRVEAGAATPSFSPSSQTPLESLTPQAELRDDRSARIWQVISALLLIVILVQFYFLSRAKKEPSENSSKDSDQSEPDAWKTLQRAIRSDNNRAIREELLRWGRTILGNQNPLSLNQLAQATGSEVLKQTFVELDKHLYKNGKKPDLSEISTPLKEFRKSLKTANKAKSGTAEQLQTLYPG